MIELKYKPLSVNICWQGKRFKTTEYKKYERDLLMILPQIKDLNDDEAFIRLSNEVLAQLGWKVGDEISIDIPMLWPNVLTITKVKLLESL